MDKLPRSNAQRIWAASKTCIPKFFRVKLNLHLLTVAQDAIFRRRILSMRKQPGEDTFRFEKRLLQRNHCPKSTIPDTRDVVEQDGVVQSISFDGGKLLFGAQGAPVAYPRLGTCACLFLVVDAGEQLTKYTCFLKGPRSFSHMQLGTKQQAGLIRTSSWASD